LAEYFLRSYVIFIYPTRADIFINHTLSVGSGDMEVASTSCLWLPQDLLKGLLFFFYLVLNIIWLLGKQCWFTVDIYCFYVM